MTPPPDASHSPAPADPTSNGTSGAAITAPTAAPTNGDAAQRPLIALTMGDPAGIGPEVIAAVWSDARVHAWCRPLVLGHPEIMRQAVALRAMAVEVVEVASVSELAQSAASSPGRMPCLKVCRDESLLVPHAQLDARGGQAAYDAVVAAAQLALSEQIDALVTAPLNKAALHLAGHFYPGHTELLAELCGVREFAMMLYLGPDDVIRGSGGLGVVHVTLHMALREALAQISTKAIVEKIHLARNVMQRLKGGAVSIGVAALNPHAGEGGLFGDEESRLIAPAVAHCQAAGIQVSGPLSADTLMLRARDGQFDGVVAMYHDQGHIALKLLGMHRAVNVTLGLPIVRTSVAHGTAFDLAWQGVAESSSMIEAIRVAALLAWR